MLPDSPGLSLTAFAHSTESASNETSSPATVTTTRTAPDEQRALSNNEPATTVQPDAVLTDLPITARTPPNSEENAYEIIENPVCVLSSAVYETTGSVGSDPRAMTTYRIPVDTCSGYNLIARSSLPDGWEENVVHDVPKPRLYAADRSPLQIGQAVRLFVRLGNNLYRLPFFVSEQLAVPLLLGTAFTDSHVRTIEPIDRRIRLRAGGSIPIVSGTRPHVASDELVQTEPPPKPIAAKHRRELDTNDIDIRTIRLAKSIRIPAMTQVGAQATTDATGLVFLGPKPTLYAKHGVRIANGVLEVRRHVPFTVLLSNFTKRDRRLPKNTVVAYAQRSSVTIIVPPPEIAAPIADALNLASHDSKPSTTTNDSPNLDAQGTGPDTTPGPACNNGITKNETTNNDKANDTSDWRSTLDLSHVKDASLRERIVDMLAKHSPMWSGKLGTIAATEHRINLEPGTSPIRSMPYRQGPAIRDIVKTQIETMLDAEVIEPANSEWASPVVLAPKKDGTLRFCVDYRKLNAKTIADAYPLPRMDDCIDSLGDATIFSTLDCNSGYWQIPVASEDRDKTTFTTFLGTYRYIRMPFGLKNAPATFQRALDIILSGVRWQTCLVYLDDVIVFSRTIDEHIANLDTVLSLLRNAGVSLKLSKCAFFQTKVDYLGHVITPGKLRVATKASEAFRSFEYPKTLTQLRSFLGACNVFRRFVQNFAKIARPLTMLTRKDASPNFENPTDEELEAFETLKQRMTSPPVLALPRHGKPYIVDTDASAYQLGCALLQEQDDETYKPVGYWSYSLNDTERNYSPTERECYSVVWSVTTLRPYIEGTKFTIRTDHDALRWLMTLTESTGRLTRWRLRLSEFDFVIQYRPGRVHQVPDALSRLIAPIENDTEVDDDLPNFDDAIALYTNNDMNAIALTAHSATERQRAVSEYICAVTRAAARRAAAPDASPQGASTETHRATSPRGSRRTRSETTNQRQLVTPRDVENETANHEPTSAPPINDTDSDLDSDDDIEDDAWDDCDDFDPFDLYRIRADDDHSDWRHLPVIDSLPLPLTIDEIREEQRLDDFCQTIIARQCKSDSAFFEDSDGLLKRRPHREPDLTQIVLPRSFRSRLLTLAHHSQLAGHPGQNRLYYTLRLTYYWPHMSVDIAATVRDCRSCARNRIRLRRHLHRLKLFPATRPLESVAIDILGPLPKTKSGYRFLLIVTDRFTKLSQVAPLRRVTALIVARVFCEMWIYKYGPPKTLLSDNGRQFTSKFFQSVCRLLGINNVFTSAYHPQTNGQAERYNPTLLASLRNYVNEHQDDWDKYATSLTYAYNSHVHRSTKTTPFDLVLSRPPPPFTLDQNANEQRPKRFSKHEFVKRLEHSLEKARRQLDKTQQRYKDDFDKRIRRTNRKLRPGDFVYLNPSDGSAKLGKLAPASIGPYRVLFNDKRTVYIDRDGLVERVNANRVVYTAPPDNAPTATATPEDLSNKVRTGPTYVVNRLSKHRMRNGVLEFLVYWENYDKPTWEPRTHIPEELVSRYFATVRRKHASRLASSSTNANE